MIGSTCSTVGTESDAISLICRVLVLRFGANSADQGRDQVRPKFVPCGMRKVR